MSTLLKQCLHSFLCNLTNFSHLRNGFWHKITQTTYLNGSFSLEGYSASSKDLAQSMHILIIATYCTQLPSHRDGNVVFDSLSKVTSFVVTSQEYQAY